MIRLSNPIPIIEDLEPVLTGLQKDQKTIPTHLLYDDKGSKLFVDNYNHAIDGIRYNVIYHLDNPNAGKYFVQ